MELNQATNDQIQLVLLVRANQRAQKNLLEAENQANNLRSKIGRQTEEMRKLRVRIQEAALAAYKLPT